ncbi:MAG: manganese-binding transcriptional regulator MntR [Planctomycetota bacterium]|jgi:DtxR family manganese transport transcriptional regulator
MTRQRWIRRRPARPGRSFRKVRADHASETAQDYVEAVSDIVHRQGECRVKDLAEHMGVSHVTVSRIIARLLDERYVETEPYRPIRLTARGERLAAESRRRHEIVFRFLIALGVPEIEAGPDAEGIEHHVGEVTLKRMEAFISSQEAGRHEP